MLAPMLLFVLFDFKLFLTSQSTLFLGHVGKGPPGLNQSEAGINMSGSRTKRLSPIHL